MNARRERASSHDDARPPAASRPRGGGLVRPCLLFCCSPLFVGTLILWVVVRSYRASLGERLFGDGGTLASSGPAPRPRSPAWNGVDVTQLRLVIDWRARRFVQQELATMAKSGRTLTREGRAELLGETIALLRRVRVAWLYAGEMNFRPMALAEAHGVFTRLAQSARAKFRRELVRADGASTRTEDAGDLRAREHEGPGVVMISLIVAARREIHDFRPGDVEDIERLLASLQRIGASELVAFEVIWSPAAEDDRMSTAELEALYPDVTRIGGIGGRVFCGYCAGPHAMELPRCPHCGAPGPAEAS